MKFENFPSRTKDIAWSAAIALLGIIFFSYSFSVASFFLGIGMTKSVFPLSLIAGIATVTALDVKRDTVRSGALTGLVLLTVMACILIEGSLYDQSYDGIRYHQETIASICDGWNPFDGADGINAPESIWPLHYAKAIEIAEASIVCFTGKMETGKAINLIMIVAVAIGVYAFLRKNPSRIFLKGNLPQQAWNRKKSLFTTLLIVGNPVVWSQWIVYYIDFYKYLYLLLVLLSFCLIASSEKCRRVQGYTALTMTLVLAMGSKFNFFFEAGLWMILAFVRLLWKKDYADLRRLIIVSAVSLGIGTLLAYHPYITNAIGYGHPLYPLMGEGSADIMSGNTPEVFEGNGRIVNFFKSLFSISVPIYDQRAGGFTILMPFILLISAIIAWRLRHSIRSVIWYVAICTLLSCFIFEQTWWARYICQLWLVGAIFLVASQCVEHARKARVAISVFMAAACLTTMTASIGISVIRGSYMHHLFETCREKPVTVAGYFPRQMKRHLDEERISYVVIDSVPENKKENALNYYYECPPAIILSKSQIESLDRRLKFFHQSTDRYRFHYSNKQENQDE